MGKTSGKSKQSPLDSLIGELINYGSDDVQSVIDILFTLDQKAISAIPLRFRIIGLGFVRKLSRKAKRYARQSRSMSTSQAIKYR